MLKGFTQIQEQGILQELFLSSGTRRPVFSSAQIDFLAPQFVEAFSRATPEEFVTFQCAPDNEESSAVEGTLSIFSPTILVLSLKTPQEPRAPLSKTTTSSKNLQRTMRIEYSNAEAVLPPKLAQRFATFPQTDSWIAIDYAASSSKDSLPETISPSPTINDPEQEPSPDIEVLQQQLQNLQKKVDDQAKEIERLQPANQREPLPHRR